MNTHRLSATFYQQDAVTVAEKLLGKMLVRKWSDTDIEYHRIVETEAYFGEEDLACHASKGRTKRTEIMYAEGGVVYVYFIYGMYWLLNVVTGDRNHPEAVLIRGLSTITGPGRVGRALELNKTFYGEDLLVSDQLWIENAPDCTDFTTTPRIGIDYAGPLWANKPWRFILN